MEELPKMQVATPVSDATATRALEHQKPGFTIARNANNEMLDEDGNVTMNEARARKIWRRTRLPDPEGDVRKYLVTLKGAPADPDKRVQQVILFGQNYPRHVYRANPDNPRQPDRMFMAVGLTDNQKEVLDERAKEEMVRIPPKRNDVGDIDIDEETGVRVRDETWVPMSDLLDLVPFSGDFIAVGAGGTGGLEAMKRIQELEAENVKLRQGQLSDVAPEDALRELLYSANLMNSEDDGPMSEHLAAIAERLQAVKRDYPEKSKGKPKTK